MDRGTSSPPSTRHEKSVKVKCRFLCMIVFAALLILTSTAQAQQAQDNAVKSAEDAFGSTVGSESVGLYSTSSARGFSPVQAGNVRLEGLYFDQQAGIGSVLAKGTTMRVGLSAQSYPFPAPTGIADIQLRLPQAKAVTSVIANYGPYTSFNGQVGINPPLIRDKLGAFISVGEYRFETDFGSTHFSSVFAGSLRWNATDNIEVIPFWYWNGQYNQKTIPLLFSGGEFLPPEVNRRVFTGQYWAAPKTGLLSYGILARTRARTIQRSPGSR